MSPGTPEIGADSSNPRWWLATYRVGARHAAATILGKQPAEPSSPDPLLAVCTVSVPLEPSRQGKGSMTGPKFPAIRAAAAVRLRASARSAVATRHTKNGGRGGTGVRAGWSGIRRCAVSVAPESRRPSRVTATTARTFTTAMDTAT
jgi:hypothetical protein